jgi:hypothetical protein
MSTVTDIEEYLISLNLSTKKRILPARLLHFCHFNCFNQNYGASVLAIVSFFNMLVGRSQEK